MPLNAVTELMRFSVCIVQVLEVTCQYEPSKINEQNGRLHRTHEIRKKNVKYPKVTAASLFSELTSSTYRHLFHMFYKLLPDHKDILGSYVQVQ